MRKPREQDTVNAILQFLHAHRIPAWRLNSGATKIGGRFIRFGVTGMADIVGVLSTCAKTLEPTLVMPYHADSLGRFLAIEVKSATGVLTKAQADFLDDVNAAGGKAFVARDVATVAKELGLV